MMNAFLLSVMWSNFHSNMSLHVQADIELRDVDKELQVKRFPKSIRDTD